MSSQREAEAVLATWREIERSLAKAEPGSPEAERLQANAALLRDEYQRLVSETLEANRAASPTVAEPTSTT